jgi:acetylglutamate synthase
MIYKILHRFSIISVKVIDITVHYNHRANTGGLFFILHVVLCCQVICCQIMFTGLIRETESLRAVIQTLSLRTTKETNIN